MMAMDMLKPDRKRRKKNVDEERTKRLKEHGSTELLPGIPHDITTQVISTMLPWTTFHILSSVSRAWQQAVQSREMYDARVRSHSTHTLAVINHTRSQRTNAIALYSLRDRACYQLPPIPHVHCGIPKSCKCIALDGKIYVLGGLKKCKNLLASDEVYVLDLAGQRQWKRCASMREPRRQFGCGVVDGKVYVFGGASLLAPFGGSEVYDPEVDAWTAVKPMTSLRFNHEVGTVGDELLVYGGRFYASNWELEAKNWKTDAALWRYTGTVNHFEIYNPVKDRWGRASEALWRDERMERFFMAEGKLHSMTRSVIFVFDVEENSRTRLHAFSYAIERLVDTPFAPEAVLVVDDKLLAIREYDQYASSGESNIFTIGLLQSRGFGVKDEEIVWERAECSLSFEGLRSAVMCTLRL